MTETKKHRVWSAVAIAGAILLLLGMIFGVLLWFSSPFRYRECREHLTFTERQREALAARFGVYLPDDAEFLGGYSIVTFRESTYIAAFDLTVEGSGRFPEKAEIERILTTAPDGREYLERAAGTRPETRKMTDEAEELLHTWDLKNFSELYSRPFAWDLGSLDGAFSKMATTVPVRQSDGRYALTLVLRLDAPGEVAGG